MLATSALVPLGIAAAFANPLGPNVVGGTAAASGVGTSSVTVTQGSNRAIINWNSFSIGAGESTRFVQPDSSAVALNRVTGNAGPSQLHGSLSANGRVFLINPDGVMIGGGARIDTAGFLATTHGITNENFMAGRYHFNMPGRPDASVVNEGRINAHSHGFAALVAPGVRNSGTITARYGKIGLASGNSFSLDFYGDQLITLAVGDSIAANVIDVATGQPLRALVKNDGKLKATGGRVELTAVAARNVVDSVINTSGVVEARSIGRREGRIVLGGPTVATKVAGAPTQTVKVSGTLSTASRTAKGGTTKVTGEAIEIKAASFDASGATGGGKVLIGGDTGGGYGHWAVESIPQAALEARAVANATTVNVDAATSINASATSVGDGGKVIVWADDKTSFAGAIAARGGATSGNGGFAEVSGKQTLAFDGLANLGAINGKAGTLLLDPLNGFIGSVAGPNTILASSIQSTLAFADVFIITNSTTGNQPGDLFVNAPITWNSNNNLWLNAHRDVVINANITNNFSGPVVDDKHLINVIADASGSGIGTVKFGPGAIIKSSGEINIAFNPTVNPVGSGVNSTSYVSATENFMGNVDLTGGGVLRHYFKVNIPADLQNVRNAPNANYMLGRDLDMANFTGFQPIANFGGSFVGLGNSIGNLTISSNASNIGLFGTLASTAEVSWLTISGFNVTAASTGGANVGALAGTNNGKIGNVEAIFSSVTATSPDSHIGGVVGRNAGQIEHVTSLTSVITVSNGAGVIINAGGLLGLNDAGGAIRKSSTTAAVITSNAAGRDVALGGVIGTNDGMAQQIWSWAPIIEDNRRFAMSGGVIGHNGATGTLDQAYSIPHTLGGASNNVGGVIGNNSNPSPGSVTNTYWTTNAGLFGLGFSGPGIGSASNGSQAGATGLTSVQLTSGSLPAGFSATDWVAIPGGPPVIPTKTFFDGIPIVGDVNSQPPPDPQPGPPGPNIVLVPNIVLDALVPNSVEAPPTTQLLQQPWTINEIEPLGALIKLTSLTTAAPPSASQGPASTLSQVPGASTLSQVPGTPPRSLAPPRPLRPVAGPDGETRSNVPPLNETRFNPQHVILQVGTDTPPALIQQIAQQLSLTVMSSQNVLGRTVVQFQINSSRSVRDTILALEANSITAVAQPNYIYSLVQQAPAAAAAPVTAAAMRRGDPAQYMTDKLLLGEAHRVASGNNVTVAVIDSEVDPEHGELAGTIAERYDATDSTSRAHSHGTAMAGAIVSRDRLLGVAPGARILAVRAFSETQTSAESTTFTILKGIDWAVSQGARVINMSFAGPYDPSLERALKDAAAKGVILIAASGNAGPKSPPLWPGADPNVIAVTATDSRDQGFREANRGPYLSVASPGVEILAPAPQAVYQMSTGTSIATAHVSGVVALMLERDPTLTPRDVRLILESTAKDLGPKGRDAQFGWGLVNPAKALTMVDERKRQRGSSSSTPIQR